MEYKTTLDWLYKWEKEKPNAIYLSQPINGEWHDWKATKCCIWRKGLFEYQGNCSWNFRDMSDQNKEACQQIDATHKWNDVGCYPCNTLNSPKNYQAHHDGH